MKYWILRYRRDRCGLGLCWPGSVGGAERKEQGRVYFGSASLASETQSRSKAWGRRQRSPEFRRQTSDNQICMPSADEASREEAIRPLYSELALDPANEFGLGGG